MTSNGPSAIPIRPKRISKSWSIFWDGGNAALVHVAPAFRRAHASIVMMPP